MTKKNSQKHFLITLVGIFLYLMISEVGLIWVFRNDILNGFYQQWKFYLAIAVIVVINLLAGHSIYRAYKND